MRLGDWLRPARARVVGKFNTGSCLALRRSSESLAAAAPSS
jgi:hypothetical protein